MTDWTAGYVVDVDYVSGFYREQTPAHINAACLVRHVTPPVGAGEGFTYCELGCGLGETALVIAATNPQAAVWGFDFNPSHVDHAQRLARAGGLDNVTFAERSFEELALSDTRDIPTFDYIALHGVWTWVSPENRAHIVAFVNKHLRPGGAVYVTYNALPGWAKAIPLQRLIASAAKADASRSDVRVRNAIQFLFDVAAADGDIFEETQLEGIRKQIGQGNTKYLAHEYLNENWAPAFHGDVARDLAGAKLGYAATANLMENFPSVCLTNSQREIVERVPAAERETMADYFLARTFRRDIFIRGARALSSRRSGAIVREQRLALAVPLGSTTRNLRLPIGEGTLNESFYEPMFRALSERTMTVGELRGMPEAEGAVPVSEEIVGMTIATNQVLAAPNALSEAAVSRARAFNVAHLRHAAGEGRPYLALACVAAGSAVMIDLPEMLAYEAIAAGTALEGNSLAEAATDLLFSRGDRLREGDRQLEDRGETLRLFRDMTGRILDEKLPVWRRLGAI